MLSKRDKQTSTMTMGASKNSGPFLRGPIARIMLLVLGALCASRMHGNLHIASLEGDGRSFQE